MASRTSTPFTQGKASKNKTWSKGESQFHHGEEPKPHSNGLINGHGGVEDEIDEDPNLPGNRWKHLQNRREQERAEAIRAKLMPDPTVRYRLDEAITMKGTCEDMCPELERHEREAKALLDPWEYLGGPQSKDKPKRIDHERAVKCYQRGSGDSVIPSDLRTRDACLRTTSYLFRLLQEHTLPATHAFVRDRARAVRLDLRVQQIEDELARLVTERCARFHTLSLHALRQLPKDKFDFGTEAEQIGQTLQSLKQYPAPHSLDHLPEFMGYYILFHIRNEPPHISPTMAKSLEVQFARQFRDEVKKASPAFGKRSELKVNAAGVELFDKFAMSMLDDSGTQLEGHWEMGKHPQWRRAVVFLVSCLLEYHFGEGCVAGMAERRGNLQDLEIIEADCFLDGKPVNTSPTPPPNPFSHPNSGLGTTTNSSMPPFMTSTLNPTATTFVPSFSTVSSPSSAPLPSALPTTSNPFTSISSHPNAFTSAFPTKHPASDSSAPKPQVSVFGNPITAHDGGQSERTSVFGSGGAGVLGSFSAPAFGKGFGTSPFSTGKPSSQARSPFAARVEDEPEPELTSGLSTTGREHESATNGSLPLRDQAPISTLPFSFKPVSHAGQTPFQSTARTGGPPNVVQSQFSNPGLFSGFNRSPSSIPERPTTAPFNAKTPFTATPEKPSTSFAEPGPGVTQFSPTTAGSSSQPFPAASTTPQSSHPSPKITNIPPTPPPVRFPATRASMVYTRMLQTVAATFVAEALAIEFWTRHDSAIVSRSLNLWKQKAIEKGQKRVERWEREKERADAWRLRKEKEGNGNVKRARMMSVNGIPQDLDASPPDVSSFGSRSERRVRRKVETSLRGQENIAVAIKERTERRQRHWAQGAFLELVRSHVSALSRSIHSTEYSYPPHWSVLLSTNQHHGNSAIWLRTKFGIEESDGKNWKRPITIGLTPNEGQNHPALVVFECSPISDDMAISDRSQILEDDCQRLLSVVSGLPSERYYTTSFLMIVWTPDPNNELLQGLPLPLSATVQSLNIKEVASIVFGLDDTDPHELFKQALVKLPIDTSGALAVSLTIRDLVKHFLQPWDAALESGIGLCRGAEDFNWTLAGYVLSSMLALLNSLATMVYKVIETYSDARYEAWKLPTLNPAGFDGQIATVDVLRAYLNLPAFTNDYDANALSECLIEDVGASNMSQVDSEPREPLLSPLKFARGLALILQNRIEGALVGQGQSLRIRVVRTRLQALISSLEQELQRTLADLHVLRRSVAASSWSSSSKPGRSNPHLKEELNGNAGVSPTSSSISAFHELRPASQPPLTLEDLLPLSSKPLSKPPVTTVSRLPHATPTMSSRKSNGRTGGLRSRAKEILEKYKNKQLNGIDNQSEIDDQDEPSFRSSTSSVVSQTSEALDRRIGGSTSSLPSPKSRRIPSHLDILKRRADEVRTKSIQSWGGTL